MYPSTLESSSWKLMSGACTKTVVNSYYTETAESHGGEGEGCASHGGEGEGCTDQFLLIRLDNNDGWDSGEHSNNSAMLYTQATEIGTDQCACLSMAEAVLSPSRTPPTGAAHHLSPTVRAPSAKQPSNILREFYLAAELWRIHDRWTIHANQHLLVWGYEPLQRFVQASLCCSKWHIPKKLCW